MNKNYKISLMLMLALALGTTISAKGFEVDISVDSTSDADLSARKKDISDILSSGKMIATKNSLLTANKVVEYDAAMSMISGGGQKTTENAVVKFNPYYANGALTDMGSVLQEAIRFVADKKDFSLIDQLKGVKANQDAMSNVLTLKHTVEDYVTKLMTAATEKNPVACLAQKNAADIEALAAGSKNLSDALPEDLKSALSKVFTDSSAVAPYMVTTYNQLSQKIKDAAEKISGQSTSNVTIKTHDTKDLSIADAALRMNILGALAQSLSDGAQSLAGVEVAKPAVSVRHLNAATGILDDVFGISFMQNGLTEVMKKLKETNGVEGFYKAVQAFDAAVSVPGIGASTTIVAPFQAFANAIGETQGNLVGTDASVLAKTGAKAALGQLNGTNDVVAPIITTIFPGGYSEQVDDVGKMATQWKNYFAKTLSAKSEVFRRDTEFKKTTKMTSVEERLENVGISKAIYSKTSGSKLNLSSLNNRYDAAEKKIAKETFDLTALGKLKEAIERDYGFISKKLEEQRSNEMGAMLTFKYSDTVSFNPISLEDAEIIAEKMKNSYAKVIAAIDKKLGNAAPTDAAKKAAEAAAAAGKTPKLPGATQDQIAEGDDGLENLFGDDEAVVQKKTGAQSPRDRRGRSIRPTPNVGVNKVSPKKAGSSRSWLNN